MRRPGTRRIIGTATLAGAGALLRNARRRRRDAARQYADAEARERSLERLEEVSAPFGPNLMGGLWAPPRRYPGSEPLDAAEWELTSDGRTSPRTH